MDDSPLARRFDHRAFVAVAMTLAAVALFPTGLGVHLLQFDQMTTARHAWMAAHASLGIFFLGFAAWHVVLNRRAFLVRLAGKREGTKGAGPELRLALAVVVLTTSLAAAHALLVR